MPVLIDLFCGRGGWSKVALAQGWKCIGYDITDHGYPGGLIRTPLPCDPQELARHKPDLIVASPPCEDYARYHLPWINSGTPPDETLLRWSIDLAGIFYPVVIECSQFARRHVPGGRYIRPYNLWGHLPAIMPTDFGTKDSRRGSSRLPRAERAARAAEIPQALADWILHHHHPERQKRDLQITKR